MPIPHYGVLKGRPTAADLQPPSGSPQPPHYVIDVDGGGHRFRVALNVLSHEASRLRYQVRFQFQPPDVTALLSLGPGWTPLESAPGGLALDLPRQGLGVREQMTLLPISDNSPAAGNGPAPAPGHQPGRLPGPVPHEQLYNEIAFIIHSAIREDGALLYVFGAATDESIHDVHMNQGNPPGDHAGENGAWQDGALLLFFPSQARWVALFLAFESQSFTTDAKGDPASVLSGGPVVPAEGDSAAAPKAEREPRRFAITRPTLQHPYCIRPPGRVEGFQPLPPPTRPAPFRMDLAEVLSADEMQRIATAGRLVFHTVGDTGNATHDIERQIAVAYHMGRQFHAPNAGDRPAFFYHLGDLVYYYGEEAEYTAQFFDVYDYYPAPIFAIAGNHDGDVDPIEPTGKSLDAFVKHFCAAEPFHPPAAHRAVRDTMTQPYVYWTLTTPLLTVIGLYSNVLEDGFLDDGDDHTQEEWFIDELTAADPDKPLIVALHHPIYSLDRHHGASPAMLPMLDNAMKESGRAPDMVFTAHVHNYQRFTRLREGRQIPHLVAGCGGFPTFYDMAGPLPTPSPTPWDGVTLEKYNTTRKGFLRMTATPQHLIGEFFTVPLPPDPKEGPTVLEDRFVLDWKQHRLVKDGP